MGRFLQTACLFHSLDESRRVLENINPGFLNLTEYLNDHFLIGLFRRRGTTKVKFEVEEDKDEQR
jgi:hypothetical protein